MSSAEKSEEAETKSNSINDAERGVTGTAAQDEVEDDGEYASGISLGLVVLGLCLAVTLVGLDNSILATAIPTITTHFNSLDDIGWYGSAFLICCCALQPISGKIYQYFSLKWTYMCYLGMFELGSLVCATAISSLMLIIGRALAGIGAAGLFSGALVIIAHSIPLRKRPIYTGIVVSMFSISNVVGPILGGAFTQHVSWRWCFYINLPLGATTAIILVTFFRPNDRSSNDLPLLEKLAQLDLPGLLLFIPSVVMLLLALQWGGNKHAWKSATVIGLIIGFGLLMMVFLAWQWHQQDKASIPPRIIFNRTIYSAVTMAGLGLGSVQLIAYYIPLWFQVVKHASPVESGIRLLPTVLANLVASIGTGALITKLGYFNPWLFVGTITLAIAGGLFSTFSVDQGNALINGAQVIGGIGCACPLIAIMSVLPERDIPIGTGISVFFQFFAGSVFLAIGENIFASRLVSALHTYAPSVNAPAVVAAGAEGLRNVVAESDLPGALKAYNVAINSTFYLCAAGAAAGFVAAWGVEWRSVKGKQII